MAARRSPGVVPDTQLTDRRVRGGARREVLVVGELPVAERSLLTARGASLTVSEKLDGVIELLAQRAFDVVVVDPFVEGNGVDFVRAVKEGADEHERTIATLYGARGAAGFLRGVRVPPLEALDAARLHHRLTPFVVLPADGRWCWVVVGLGEASHYEDVKKVPLVTIVLSADSAKLLKRAGPMA